MKGNTYSFWLTIFLKMFTLGIQSHGGSLGHMERSCVGVLANSPRKAANSQYQPPDTGSKKPADDSRIQSESRP